MRIVRLSRICHLDDEQGGMDFVESGARGQPPSLSC